MKTRSIAVATILGAFMTTPLRVVAGPPAPPTTANSSASTQYVPGEVLVKFKPTTTVQSSQATIASRGHTVLARLSQPGWEHVKVGAGQTVDESLAAYSNDPSVEYAQPNYIYHIAAAPNDPQYGQLWAFKNSGQTISSAFTQPPSSPLQYPTNNPGAPGDDMDIERAWGHITDCSSVVVAVVDTGINYNHEDLGDNMWDGGPAYPHHGYDFVDNDNDPMDLGGHGTHVAGIIGAVGNNAKGTTGVCWQASIMAVRVLGTNGGTSTTVIHGVNFAVSNGAKVINMSLGGGGAFDQLYSDAITAAQDADVVVVVAAGNYGSNNDSGTTPMYPCNFSQPNLVCVAALDQSYALASFSDWGSASVDVGAPGTNILSTWTGTKAVMPDTLNSGWLGSSTTAGTGGGWFYSTIGGTQSLVDAASYPNGSYNNSTDDRVYKSFNLAGATLASLQFSAAVNVVNGDHFRAGYVSTAVDPFAGTGTILWDTKGATYPNRTSTTFDVSDCIGANCTIGFQLQSDASLNDLGVGIADFSINTLTVNSTSYNTENGTSMASPEVAGLATMLRAYHPQYTSADVVSAIENAGRPVSGLAGKTTTGKAIDVMASLAYINAPTGLVAVVQ